MRLQGPETGHSRLSFGFQSCQEEPGSLTWGDIYDALSGLYAAMPGGGNNKAFAFVMSSLVTQNTIGFGQLEAERPRQDTLGILGLQINGTFSSPKEAIARAQISG